MKFQMNDEIEVDVEITFSGLYELKHNNDDDYKKINMILSRGAKDIFDYLFVIYVGYIIANKDRKYTYDEFIKYTDFNWLYIARVANSLHSPKKK